MPDIPEHLVWLHERHGAALSAALDHREGIELTPGSAIAAFARADPTPGLRLTDWLVRTYVERATFKFEDVRAGPESTVGTTLALFVAKRGTLSPDARNINLYDSPGALWKAVGGDAVVKPSKREDRDRARAESAILLDDERGIVAVPLTQFAASWWGRGTRWCTAAREHNAFHSYAGRGPLFILILPDGTKAQLHMVGECPMMDAADVPITGDNLAAFHDVMDPIIRWALDDNGFAIRLGSPRLQQDRDAVIRAVRSNAGAFLYVLDAFDDDDEIAGMAVSGSPTTIAYVSPRLRNDKNLVLKAVKGHNQGLVLSVTLSRMRADRDVVLEAVRVAPRAVEYASKALRDDREIALAAVTGMGSTLQFLGDRMRSSREVVMKAIESDGDAFLHASSELRKDRDVVMSAVRKSGSILEKVTDDFSQDREIVLAAVRQFGLAIWSAAPDLQDDPEVIRAALIQNGEAIRFMNPRIRADKSSVLAAVSSSGHVLRYVDMDLRKDREVVLAAIGQNGYAIEFADEGLRADRSIVMAAVAQNGMVLLSVERQHWHDRDIVMTAVSQNGYAIACAPPDFWNDKEIVLTAIARDLTARHYVLDTVRHDPDLMTTLRQDPDVLAMLETSPNPDTYSYQFDGLEWTEQGFSPLPCR